MPLLISCFLVFVAVKAKAVQPLRVITPQYKHSFSLDQLKHKLKSHVIKIDDPIFKKAKTYDAFSLLDVLNLAGVKPGQGADELVFTAKDGYAPTMPFENLQHYHGYIAYQEHGQPGHFEKIQQGKSVLSPAPYYLIWKEGKAAEDKVPWPYQLVSIELIDFSRRYAKAYPKGASANSNEHTGFLLFAKQCMRCHSVNLEGGTVGPELNSPKNVTEYWRADILPRFIRNAGRFRYRSKMPPFPNLTSHQIDQILAYLRYMKDHKVRD